MVIHRNDFVVVIVDTEQLTYDNAGRTRQEYCGFQWWAVVASEVVRECSYCGTTVNDSETIGRTNGVNHRRAISIAERFVHLCLL